MATPFLNITEMQPGQAQAHIVFNEGLRAIERATVGQVVKIITGNTTLTLAESQMPVVLLTGNPANTFTLTLSDIQHVWLIRNATSKQCIVSVGPTSNTIAIPATSCVWVINDNTSLYTNDTHEADWAQWQEDFEAMKTALKRTLKPPITTRTLIESVYPNPEDGWIVRCIDTGFIYRYNSTTGEWIHIETIISNAEQIRVPYAPIITVEFDIVQAGSLGYVFPPVINANLIYDPGVAHNGALSATYNMFPVVSMVSRSVNGTLYYTGFKIHFVGSSVPASITNTFVSIVAIVKE